MNIGREKELLVRLGKGDRVVGAVIDLLDDERVRGAEKLLKCGSSDELLRLQGYMICLDELSKYFKGFDKRLELLDKLDINM